MAPLVDRLSHFTLTLTLSAGKVMLIAFWGIEELVYTEFMQKGFTINSQSFCDTLQKIKTRIRCIRSILTTFLVNNDSAKPHYSKKIFEIINRLKF